VEAATLVPLILSTILFTNRIAAKFMGLGGGWGADDITIIVAYVSIIPLLYIVGTLAETGFRHWQWRYSV
jgi:hypothetical protein